MAARNRKDLPMMPSVPAYHRPFAPREPWLGPTEIGSAISKHLLKELKSFGRRVPSKDWAPRVLERAAMGEPICQHAIDLARSVVNEPATIEREPGSDDA